MNEELKNEYRPNYATSPGEVLLDYMEGTELENDVDAFAQRVDLDRAAAERLLRGEAPVTPEIATALERLFGRPAHFWLAMEDLYRQDLARLRKKRGGARPGAGRKANPRHRYAISLPGELGRELNARAEAAGVTPYRWIVNELTLRLQEKQA